MQNKPPHPAVFPELRKTTHAFLSFPEQMWEVFQPPAEAGTSERVLINPDPWMLTANPVYGLQERFTSQRRRGCVPLSVTPLTQSLGNSTGRAAVCEVWLSFFSCGCP